jgi:hypothetical protein
LNDNIRFLQTFYSNETSTIKLQDFLPVAAPKEEVAAP